jgi:perosamine synthetase
MPEFKPTVTWPPQHPQIEDMLQAAYNSGAWGKYSSEYSEQLIAQLQRQFQVECVYPVCSGTFASELALRMLHLPANSEVLLAAYDFSGNFRAIQVAGHVPTLVDLAPNTWSLNLQQLAEITETNVKAVLVSHLHGYLAPMPEIMQLAKTRGWLVVEDCCQAPGASIMGKPVGSWGDIATLSFGGSKLLTAGRGGAVLTSEQQYLQRAKIYCEQGNHAYPLSELQAAVLLPQLELLPLLHKQRASAVAAIKTEMANMDLAHAPFQFSMPQGELVGDAAYYKLGFLVTSSASAKIYAHEIASRMRACGIEINVGFEGFAHRSAKRCRKLGDLTNAQHAAQGTLVLHHTALLEPPEKLREMTHIMKEILENYALELRT